MDVIGSTLEEIAAEKSGVIKANRPCILGPSCEQEAMMTKANQVNAQLIRVQTHKSYNEVNNQIVKEVLRVVSEKEKVQVPTEHEMKDLVKVS